LLKLAFPIKSPAEIHANDKAMKNLGMLRWEDGKDHALPQDFADMRGWKELAYKTDSVYTSLNAPANTWYCVTITDRQVPSIIIQSTKTYRRCL
jgi:hypothetical protein